MNLGKWAKIWMIVCGAMMGFVSLCQSLSRVNQAIMVGSNREAAI